MVNMNFAELLTPVFQGVIDQIPENSEHGQPVGPEFHLEVGLEPGDLTNAQLRGEFVLEPPQDLLEIYLLNRRPGLFGCNVNIDLVNEGGNMLGHFQNLIAIETTLFIKAVFELLVKTLRQTVDANGRAFQIVHHRVGEEL